MYEADLYIAVAYTLLCKLNYQARRKQCGMAVVAAPKICREREREKEEKGGKKRKEEKEKWGEKGRKWRADQERKMYYVYMGVKHPLRTVKRLLKTRGVLKKLKKKKKGREEEET